MATRGNEWTALDTPSGFERCVRGSVRELYGYVALLTGRDRAKTERLVTDVYRSLFRAANAGQLDAVRLSSLRSAGRRLWLERNDAELARPARLSAAPVKSIAELSVIERAVVVLRHVNGMSDERAGDELGRPAAEVAAVSDHAVRRLRGTTDTSGAWLRAYFDASVAPRAGLVDRIVGELGPRDDTPAAASVVDEPTAPIETVEADAITSIADEPTAPIETVEPIADEPTETVEADASSSVADEPTAPIETIEPVSSDAASSIADESPTDTLGTRADEPGADEPTAPLPVVGAAPPPDDAAGPVESGDATAAIERSWRELSIAELGGGTTVPPIAAGDELAPTGVPVTGDDAAELATSELPATGAAVGESHAAGKPERASSPVVPVVPPSERSAARRWWPIALIALFAVGLFAAWWWLVRDDDGSATSGSTVIEAPVAMTADIEDTTPTTDVADTTPTTDAADTAPTTDAATSTIAPTTVDAGDAASTAPVTPSVVLVDGEASDRFDPACVAWYAQPTPVSPARPTVFGPLGAEPAVTVTIPGVADGIAATLVEPAGDGLLISLFQSDDDGTGSATVLARVGIDGIVHWVRCYDEPMIVVGEPNADLAAAVGRFVGGQLGWYLVSMADGDVSTPVDPVTELALNVIYERGPAEPTGATARWVDGVLTGFDADGNVTWTDPDVSTLTGEGFVLAVGDDLAIAHVCDDGACEAGRLRAYDLATGDLAWERPGFRNVAAVADGYALIGDPTVGWELVTSADGIVVDGQRWDDPELFITRCCGEGEVWFTEQIGGLVVAARPGAIDIWLPVESSGGAVTTDLAPPD